MNIRPRPAVASLLAVAAFACGLATASAQTAATGRIPTISRLVMLFTEQETKLAARIRAHDAAGAGGLLTDDFELRAGSQPGRPVPREDWLRQSMASPGPDATPTQMAVHDLGGTAVVSFRLDAQGAKANLFVVDVWRRAGDDWKLAIRYVAPASGTSMPGVPRAEPEIPKRY